MFIRPLIAAVIIFTAGCKASKQTEINSTQVGVEVESCIPDVPPSQPDVTVIALHDEAEFEFIPASE